MWGFKKLYYLNLKVFVYLASWWGSIKLLINHFQCLEQTPNNTNSQSHMLEYNNVFDTKNIVTKNKRFVKHETAYFSSSGLQTWLKHPILRLILFSAPLAPKRCVSFLQNIHFILFFPKELGTYSALEASYSKIRAKDKGNWQALPTSKSATTS